MAILPPSFKTCLTLSCSGLLAIVLSAQQNAHASVQTNPQIRNIKSET
jgi:hypothetical protein